MPTEGPLENSLYLLTQGNAEAVFATHGMLRPSSVDAAVKNIKATAQQSLDSVANLKVQATAQPANTTPAATLTGPVEARVLNIGIPAGRDGMGYAQGQQLLADSAAVKGAAAQSASSAAQAVTLAQQAQAAAYAVPDTALVATQSNPESDSVKKRGVLVPATIDHAGVQAALTSAASSGLRVQAAGSYTTDQTLVITGDADLSGLTINYTGTGTAVQVGNPTSLLFRRAIRLPLLIAANKGGANGWVQVAGTIGVRVTNLYSCKVYVPRIANFETGFLGHGQTPNGTSYCVFDLGHIDNCKVGLQLAPQDWGVKSTSGWFNQNLFIGGRLSHNSNEGSQVPGTRNILISHCTNNVNNNVFLNTAIESPDVVDYHIECYGQYNYFDRTRFENTGGDTHRRVWWRAASKGNIINGGFNAGHLAEVTESGAVNDIRSDVFNRFTGGTATKPTMVLENLNSSTAPAFTILPAGSTAAGADPASSYAVKASANTWNGKRGTDAYDRLIMDFSNGRIYVGNATAAPTAYWTGSPNSMLLSPDTSLYFLTDNTADIGGSTSLRPRYVRAATAVQTGAGTTNARPAPATARAGAMWFDTTLGKPIWSTGSAWVDATGATV